MLKLLIFNAIHMSPATLIIIIKVTIVNCPSIIYMTYMYIMDINYIFRPPQYRDIDTTYLFHLTATLKKNKENNLLRLIQIKTYLHFFQLIDSIRLIINRITQNSIQFN